MFDIFDKRFSRTDVLENRGRALETPPYLAQIFAARGGATYANGFYRFHTPESAVESNISCANLIRGFAGRFHCFAFDWLGRELAVDMRDEAGNGNVIAVDFGGGEYLKTDCPLSEWHDAVAGDEDPLAYPFYEEWRASNPGAGALGFDQVIGYSVPLFLGGSDEVTNLEVATRAVYSELCTQLAHGVKELPVGSTINSFSIAEA